MATDHAVHVEAESPTEAYISPTADFLVLAVLTTVVALGCAAVIIP